MAIKANPVIVRDGLVLALDAANPSNYNLTAVEVLVVAGGGGAAADVGGAGGAGGLVYNSNFSVTSGIAITVTVGAGGTGRPQSDSNTSNRVRGASGSNSVFGSITAIGGGGGGCYGGEGPSSGGSGGGGAGTSQAGAAGTTTQGNSGGAGKSGGAPYGSGGGGGAGQSGFSASESGIGGNGGDGLFFGQFSSVGGFPAGWFAGGGGGGGGNDSGSDGRGFGGLGGGGTGASRSGTYATNSSFKDAVTNTGGGGGGTGGWNNGGNGGSGIVIIRYPGPQKALGGTVTFKDGFTIHTFTTVGSTTFTPLSATNNASIAGLGDLSGGGNGGTSVNGPTYSSANGGSIVFDGTNDYVSTSSALSGSFASFTVIVWFYPTSVTNYQNPIDCNYSYNGTTGNIGPRLEIYTTGQLLWIYSNDTGNNNNFYYHNVVSSGLAANTWHYAAITYNGSSNTSTTYYNGNATGLSRTLSGTPTGFVGVMNNVTIGKGFHLGGSERIFAGRVSNTQIYNRALTAAEISQNYYATKSRYGL